MGLTLCCHRSTTAIAAQSDLSCEISYSVQRFQDDCIWNRCIRRQEDAQTMTFFRLAVENNQTILKAEYKYLAQM